MAVTPLSAGFPIFAQAQRQQAHRCFKSSGIRLPLCRVTFPLENDQETTTLVSLASDNVPPAGERQV